MLINLEEVYSNIYHILSSKNAQKLSNFSIFSRYVTAILALMAAILDDAIIFSAYYLGTFTMIYKLICCHEKLRKSFKQIIVGSASQEQLYMHAKFQPGTSSGCNGNPEKIAKHRYFSRLAIQKVIKVLVAPAWEWYLSNLQVMPFC